MKKLPTAELLLSELRRKYPNHCRSCGGVGFTPEGEECPDCFSQWKDPLDISEEWGNGEAREGDDDVEPYFSGVSWMFLVNPEGWSDFEREDEAGLLCALAKVTPDDGAAWRKLYTPAQIPCMEGDDQGNLEASLEFYLEDYEGEK